MDTNCDVDSGLINVLARNLVARLLSFSPERLGLATTQQLLSITRQPPNRKSYSSVLTGTDQILIEKADDLTSTPTALISA